jgi:hypothetical protein
MVRAPAPDGPERVYLVTVKGRRNDQNRVRSGLFIAATEDDGATFTQLGEALASNLSYEYNNSVVLKDGRLILSFGDHHRYGDDRRLRRPRDWMLTSSDGGKTFSEPILVSESCDGRGRWPSMASDSTGRLFWLCVADDLQGVLAQHSDTHGELWSDPIRIDKSPGRTQTSTAAIAVTPSDLIGIAWYDGRADVASPCSSLYFAVSRDRGTTYTERRVSSAMSCPDGELNGTAAKRFPHGGDYFGFIAVGDREFLALWSDSRSGRYQLRTALIRVNLIAR